MVLRQSEWIQNSIQRSVYIKPGECGITKLGVWCAKTSDCQPKHKFKVVRPFPSFEAQKQQQLQANQGALKIYFQLQKNDKIQISRGVKSYRLPVMEYVPRDCPNGPKQSYSIFCIFMSLAKTPEAYPVKNIGFPIPNFRGIFKIKRTIVQVQIPGEYPVEKWIVCMAISKYWCSFSSSGIFSRMKLHFLVFRENSEFKSEINTSQWAQWVCHCY